MKNVISKLFLCLIPSLLATTLVGCKDNESSSFSSSEAKPTTYANPVWEPLCPDPGAVRGDNGKYYAYCTEEMGDWGSQGYKKLVVPILESEDLVSWDCIGSAFTIATMPLWNQPDDQIWAPDVCKVQDKYIMSYSLTSWANKKDAIGIAVADNPWGPWVDKGKLFDVDSIGVYNCIDSCIFVDDDGRVYMTFGSFAGVFGIELTSDGQHIKEGATKVLLAGDGSTGKCNWSKDFEGSFLRKINGEYYLFLSSGTCCEGFDSSYHVRVCKASSPLGPYYDDNGKDMVGYESEIKGTIVVGPSDRFIGVGHNAIIQDDVGDYYIMYHGYDTTKAEKVGTCNRRCLLIDKLIFDENGFPHTKDYIPSENAERPVVNEK